MKVKSQEVLANAPRDESVGDLEEAIARFEAAWQSGVPDLHSFLSLFRFEDTVQARLLHELVLIDLEFRWRQFGTSFRSGASDAELHSAFAVADALNRDPRATLLEEYTRTYPRLCDGESIPLELIGEEYRVRQRWGDRPGIDEYLRRFPAWRAQLRDVVDQIDQELRRETEPTVRLTPAAEFRPETAASSGSAFADEATTLTDRDFIIEQHLGSGGIGRVYRVRRKSDDCTLAMKVLSKASQRDEFRVRRFVVEAQILASLVHPGIVRLHSLGRMRNASLFLVMDFVGGGDLAQRLASGPLPARLAADCVRQAADAVEHAHAHGVVHCDLKPANLLVDDGGLIKLTDFGLAAWLPGEGGRAISSGGTIGYMAPEQIDPAWGAVTPQTDVFGLGAVLAALLTGQSPCPGSSVDEVLLGILEGRHLVPVLSLSGQGLQSLMEVCCRCLAPSAAERFASAGAVAQELRRCLEGID
ncbi:MAG: serine/threonine-protein kinase [Planctomycetales bacterium]